MYAAVVDSQRLTFEAEAVWRRNMIMRDRETGTLWQHSTGQALVGPLAGEWLLLLPGRRLTLGGWLEEHPASTIAQGPEKWPGLLPLRLTRTVLGKATASGRVPGLSQTDRRFDQNQEIVGVTLDGATKAYPLECLKQRGLIHDELNGVTLALVYWRSTQEVRVYRLPGEGNTPRLDQEAGLIRLNDNAWDSQGQPKDPSDDALALIEHKRTWWVGWYEFHPDTVLYSVDARVE